MCVFVWEGERRGSKVDFQATQTARVAVRTVFFQLWDSGQIFFDANFDAKNKHFHKFTCNVV